MDRFIATIIMLFTMLVLSPAAAQDNKTCPSIRTWSEVPEPIRIELVSKVGRIAEKGQRFNATDVVSGDLANNRFLAGCTSVDLVAVALERGGRMYRIQVFQFKSGKFTKSWIQQLDKSGSVTVDLLQQPEPVAH